MCVLWSYKEAVKLCNKASAINIKRWQNCVILTPLFKSLLTLIYRFTLEPIYDELKAHTLPKRLVYQDRFRSWLQISDTDRLSLKSLLAVEVLVKVLVGERVKTPAAAIVLQRKLPNHFFASQVWIYRDPSFKQADLTAGKRRKSTEKPNFFACKLLHLTKAASLVN